MTSDAADMQLLLDAVRGFCQATGMAVSPEKTFVMVFGRESAALTPLCWQYGGQARVRVQQGKYLGLMLHEQWGVCMTFHHLRQKMWGAWATLKRQFAGLRCGGSVELLLRVFRACVPPVAQYGCEVWGMMHTTAALQRQRASLNASYIQMLRSIAGVRGTTPEPVVLLELGCTSLVNDWCLRVLRFWNALELRRRGQFTRASLCKAASMQLRVVIARTGPIPCSEGSETWVTRSPFAAMCWLRWKYPVCGTC